MTLVRFLNYSALLENLDERTCCEFTILTGPPSTISVPETTNKWSRLPWSWIFINNSALLKFPIYGSRSSPGWTVG